MKSAKKLLQFDFDTDAFARCALQPMEIHQDVRDLLGKIISEHGNENGSLIEERHRQIYFLFCNTSLRRLPEKFSTRSQVRKLARVLTYSEGVDGRIIDIPALCYALQLIESRFSIGAFHGVCLALQQVLDTQDTQYIQMLGAFVKKYTTNSKLLRSRMALLDILRGIELPDYTHGYRYFGAIAGAYKSISRPCDKLTVADIVEFAAGGHRDDLTNRDILSELIEQLGSDASEQLRQPIQSYALQKWKEPRIAGTDWKGISDKAQRIFTRWIIEKDFYFFFDAIAKAVNAVKFEDRRRFWLAYFEHITYCRPILSRGAESLFKDNQQALEYYRDRRPPILEGGAENQHALIIEMRGHIFVEFSIARMCYVYDKSVRPFQLNASSYRMSELLNMEFTHRETRSNSENNSWQSRLASWIATKFDIKPLRSYRLDGRANTYTISEKIKSR